MGSEYNKESEAERHALEEHYRLTSEMYIHRKVPEINDMSDLRLKRFWVPYHKKDYRVSLYDLYAALATSDQGAYELKDVYELKMEVMGDCIWNECVFTLDYNSFWEFFDIAHPQIEVKIYDKMLEEIQISDLTNEGSIRGAGEYTSKHSLGEETD